MNLLGKYIICSVTRSMLFVEEEASTISYNSQKIRKRKVSLKCDFGAKILMMFTFSSHRLDFKIGIFH